jgi:hypothetical protein
MIGGREADGAPATGARRTLRGSDQTGRIYREMYAQAHSGAREAAHRGPPAAAAAAPTEFVLPRRVPACSALADSDR